MKARAGVTLMELIVALTITGFMAAVGTATFSSIIDNKRVIRESTTATERSASLRETLRQWLLPATIQIQQGGVPTGRGQTNVRTVINARVSSNGAEAVTPAAASGDDELTFTTTAPNPTNAPNARMRLFIDTDEATPEHGLTLEYQVNQQSPLQRIQLDTTVGALTVEFLDRRTGRWYPAKEASTIQRKAVRLTLLAAEGDSVPPLMQLPMVFAISGFVVTNNVSTPVR